MKSAAPASPLPGITVKGYGSAAFGKHNSPGDCADVDGFGGKFEKVFSDHRITARSRCHFGSSAHWREDCQLVAFMNLAIGLGILLVHSQQQRTTKSFQIRMKVQHLRESVRGTTRF